MRNFLIGNCMNLIRKEQPQLSEIQLEQIEYGLAGVYLSITKVIIIMVVAILLGILKEYLYFLAIFAIIRTNAYGMHASKSWICLLFSSVTFLGFPLLAIYMTIPFLVKYILGIATILYIFKYSPADTKKRPIISKQKRLRHKLLATLTAIIFVILSLFITNPFVSNCFIWSLVLMCIMISPITYKLFNLPYNNYLNYVS